MTVTDLSMDDPISLTEDKRVFMRLGPYAKKLFQRMDPGFSRPMEAREEHGLPVIPVIGMTVRTNPAFFLGHGGA